jgi:hypothetical protein
MGVIMASEKTAAQLADIVLLRCKLASLSPDEIEELSKDLQTQLSMRGETGARAALPREDMAPILAEIQKANSRKSMAGLAGIGAGGLVGGVGAALLAALTRGKDHALTGGVLGVIPGAFGGYHLGKHLQQRQDLTNLLREKLR